MATSSKRRQDAGIPRKPKDRAVLPATRSKPRIATAKLHAAVRAGNRARLTALLYSGTADLDALDEDGITPLYYAAAEGNAGICTLLLSHGATVDATSTIVDNDQPYELTALFIAVNNGHTETCSVLLDAGAAIDHVEPRDGKTPPLWAAEWGRLATHALLLERGADVNHADHSGTCSLMCAVEDLEMCTLLIQHDAKVNQVDNDGLSPLYMAASAGLLDVCRLLLDHAADVNHGNSKGHTALMLAANEGHLEVCRPLIQRPAPVDVVDHDGYSALMFAAMSGHLDTCRLLVRNCAADVNHSSSSGDTALALAAKKGHLGITRLLLKSGANVHHGNQHGASPL